MAIEFKTFCENYSCGHSPGLAPGSLFKTCVSPQSACKYNLILRIIAIFVQNKLIMNIRYYLSLAAVLLATIPSMAQEPQWLALEPARETVLPGVHFGFGVNGNYLCPQFRTTFDLQGKVKSATAKVCGLGHFEFMLNGKKVGDHFLDPGWTCYDKEALYVDFDVTKELQKGGNTIDVMLGTGFYTVPAERYKKLVCSYGQPKLWMEMEIVYKNGETQKIVTDAQNWKVCQSPVTYSSIYGGETYDARKVASLEWKQPLVVENNIVLKPQDGTELTVRKEIPEKEHFLGPDGNWIIDFGQNQSGIVRVTASGKTGQGFQMWPGELLDEKGDVSQAATGAPYYWEYILASDGKDETWQPQFTYYGHRYVKLVGAVPEGEDNPQGFPVVKKMTALHTCVNYPEVGSFTCGVDLFNRTHELIDWAIRSNSQSVFTDCPHREKLGWMEQDYLMQYSIQYRYNALPVYKKVLDDMEASQWENGCIPTIAPMYVMFEGGFEDTPEWGSAFIICPWYAYLWYGDKSMIEKHYPAMQRYITYLGTRANDNIIAYGLGDWFDLGPGALGNSQLTSNGVSATAIYYYDVTLMSKMAELLGKSEDKAAYDALAEQIKVSFNNAFYNEEAGNYDRNSQTANAMPLYFGLVEEQNREKVLASLIGDIKDRNYALTAGDIGYRFVLQALQDAGRSDVIYKMNNRDDVPGYGWQLAHGATALTESWQAFAQVSNNHLMLGHIMEWFYGGLCGITQTPESVGFEHVLIKPAIIPEVGYASGSLETIHGIVESSWKVKGDKVIVKFRVPKGCDAQVKVLDVDKTFKAGKHKVKASLAE